MPGGGCRAGRMASAGRCAYFYRLARPLPLGAGDYVRPAGIGSACGEGVGGIVEVLHILLLVVVSSPLHLSRHRFSLLASSSCFLRPFLSPVFLRGFLSSFSPFLRLAGRGVLCLLVSSSLRLSPPSRVLVLACLRRSFIDRSLRLSPASHAVVVLCGYSVPPLVLFISYRPLCSFVCPPRFSTSAGRGACRLVLCLLALWCCRASGGRCRLDGVGGTDLLLGVSASGGVLCLVCGVGVCIYKWGACSGIIIVVERKRLRRDFRR